MPCVFKRTNRESPFDFHKASRHHSPRVMDYRCTKLKTMGWLKPYLLGISKPLQVTRLFTSPVINLRPKTGFVIGKRT
ncbi:hypothetical protein CEXT_211261 [Caerostris extrusa]|uniref:Uncharacterized protein n=1 Tax=Caerostris extrusa TaxID=172846 RepID=A0AAV4NBY3_CAEEX|nr:hypothetical protein CEXT_211261 [Caerostris extrusa]